MVAQANALNPIVRPSAPVISAKADTRPLLSGAVMEALGLIGDFKGALTGTYDAIAGLLGRAEPVQLSALGFASWVWIPLGVLLAKDAWDSDAVLKKIGDVWGRCIGACRFMKGVGLAVGGSIMLPVRVLTLTGSKRLLSVASRLGTIGSTFFGSANVFAVGVHSMSLSHSIPFYLHIRSKSATAILQELKNRLEITPAERAEIEERIAKEFPLAERPAKITEALDLLVQKKESELKRVCSGACVQRIRAATPEQAQQVIKEVLAATREKIALDMVAGTLSFIGAAVTFIGFALTSAAAILALQIISALSSLGWVGIDTYTWHSAMKDDEHGRGDMGTLIFNALVCLGASGLAFALTSNPAVIIAAVILAVITTGINVSTYLHHRK